MTDAAAARGAPGTAVVALGGRAVPALRHQLGGDAPLRAETAAILLGRLGTGAREALGDLVDALEDDVDRVRAESAAAIELIGWPEGVELDALSAKIADPDPAVRRIAFRAAVDTGRLSSEVVAGRLAEHETREECADALRRLHGRAVETLAKLLEHPSRRVRRAAAEALATSGVAAARVAPALAAAAHKPDPRLQASALAALLGSGDATEVVRRAFLDAASSPDAVLRAPVVLALADSRFDGSDTERVLAAATADPDLQVRLAAAIGGGLRGCASETQGILLARTAAKDGLPTPYRTWVKRYSAIYADRDLRGGGGNLRGHVSLRSPTVAEAWPALRACGTPAALTALRAAWPDAEEAERVALLRAFTALGIDGAADLRSRLDDPSWPVRREAALCLSTLGDAGVAALPVLIQLVDQEPDPSQQPEDYWGRVDAAVVAALGARLAEVLPTLVSALEAYASSPGTGTRPGPPRVFEILREDGEAAAPAALAVVRVLVETPLAYPGADTTGYAYPQEERDTLLALGDPAVRALAARLLDADRDVRWRARRALRDLGKAAGPALEALDRAAASGPEKERAEYAQVAKSVRGAAR